MVKGLLFVPLAVLLVILMIQLVPKLMVADDIGPELQEAAEVVDLKYSQGQEGSGLATGFSTSGHMTVTPLSYGSGPVYSVVFKCAHGKFVVEGKEDHYRELWSKLEVGQQVTVKYREIVSTDINGQKKVERDFLGAEPLKTSTATAGLGAEQGHARE